MDLTSSHSNTPHTVLLLFRASAMHRSDHDPRFITYAPYVLAVGFPFSIVRIFGTHFVGGSMGVPLPSSLR